MDELKHVNDSYKYLQSFNFVIRGLQFDNHFTFHKNCETIRICISLSSLLRIMRWNTYTISLYGYNIEYTVLE